MSEVLKSVNFSKKVKIICKKFGKYKIPPYLCTIKQTHTNNLNKKQKFTIMATITYPTFSDLMGCGSHRVFKNEAGETATVSYSYHKNTKIITVWFLDTTNMAARATRNAIRSTSEKKVAKVIVDGGFTKI